MYLTGDVAVGAQPRYFLAIGVGCNQKADKGVRMRMLQTLQMSTTKLSTRAVAGLACASIVRMAGRVRANAHAIPFGQQRSLATGKAAGAGVAIASPAIVAHDGPLRRMRLGSSDLEVTDVCLGSMTWGVQNSEQDAHAQLDYAIKNRGVNFVDTAEMYPSPNTPPGWAPGITEKYIGQWLSENPAWRSRIVLATKVSGYSPKSPAAGARSNPPRPRAPARLDAESVRSACHASLRRLQTDYIDLYQVHWPDRYAPTFGALAYDPSKDRPDSVPIEETLGALLDLKAEGAIRHFGLSNETAFGVCEWARACAAAGCELPATIQNDFSLLNRGFEEALAECCAPSHHNISLLPWSPLCGGALTGKYLNGSPEGSRFTLFPKFQGRYLHEQARFATEQYTRIAEEAGITPTTLALQWCQSRWYVGSTIVGATCLQQLQENIDAFDGHVTRGLTDDVLKAVDKVHNSCRNPCSFVATIRNTGRVPVPGRE